MLFAFIGATNGADISFYSPCAHEYGGTQVCAFIDLAKDETKEELLLSVPSALSSENSEQYNGIKTSVAHISNKDDTQTTKIDRFPVEIFTLFKDLRGISIRGSPITEIAASDFDNVKDLLYFSVTGSESLRKLSTGTFPSKLSLEKLHLDRNEIEVIEDFTFLNLSSLEWLFLKENKLTTITRNTFTGLFELYSLNLVGNQIHTIEDGAFTDLMKLKELNLASNKLKTLTDHVFDGLIRLDQLNIESNQIDNIGNSLHSLIVLEGLTLTNNSINCNDLVKFTKLPRLSYLGLNTNRLNLENCNVNSSDDLTTSSSVRGLHLESNNITQVASLETLRIFPNLRYLNLRGNEKINDSAAIKQILQPFMKNDNFDFDI